MTEQKSQQSSSGNNPLQTEKGNTTIQNAVVSKIAGIASQEVEGRPSAVFSAASPVAAVAVAARLRVFRSKWARKKPLSTLR
jgi:hypothetical protein